MSSYVTALFSFDNYAIECMYNFVYRNQCD